MNNSRPAFTLLEIILYLFIFAVIGLAVFSFSQMAFSVNAHSQIVAEVDSDGSALMQRLIGYIHRTPSNGINYPLAMASSDSLSITTTDSATTPVVISLQSGVVVVSEAGGEPVAMSSNRVRVSDLQFQNLGTSGVNDIIRISFRLANNNQGNRAEFDYSRSFTSAASPLLR